MRNKKYPYVVASSERFRIVRKSEMEYALDEWDDGCVDSMGKPVSPQWKPLRCIWFEGNSPDYSIQPFIEIMENGWITQGGEQP